MESEIVEWLRSHFLPFEAELRARLRRVCEGPAEVDDVIQETYYKLMLLGSLEHVREPKAFLVRTAKNIVIDRMRREAIVSIEAMANLEQLEMADSAPTPERVAAARSELKWVMGLIDNLPERCKAVFRSRRIYGMSQCETAETLGVSEGIVEQETMKGMALIADMVTRVGALADVKPPKTAASKRLLKQKNVAH